MANSKQTGGYLPTPEQLLLLRACAFTPQVARPAWEEWRRHFRPETVDDASARLLPTLYRSLQNCGYSGPEMPFLKRWYQRNFYQSRLLFHTAEEALATLHAVDIPTMLLKGVALSHCYYPDPYMRCMSDADIAVPTKHAETALATLQAAGWMLNNPLGHPYPPTPYARRIKRQMQRTLHASHLVNDRQQDLDLHWHVIADCCGLNDDDAFWKRAVSLMFGAQKTQTLSPTDHLLHACLHGYVYNANHSMRWILDAHMILETSGGDIAWDAMTHYAIEMKLTLRLREALEFLRSVWGAPIPDSVLEQLRAVPVSSSERSEHNLLIQGDIRDPHQQFLWPLRWAWHRQRRRFPGRSVPMRILTFPAMLSNELYLGGVCQLPVALIRIAVVKLHDRYGA